MATEAPLQVVRALSLSSLRFFLGLAWVAVALGGCGAKTGIVLTLEGNLPEAKALKLRVIGVDGPWPEVIDVPARALPAVVTIETPEDAGRIGVVVWAVDGAGAIVGRALSGACMRVTPRVEAKYDLALEPAPTDFSPSLADRCRCQADMPKAAMCPGGDEPPGPVDPSPGRDGGAAPGADAGGAPGPDAPTAPGERLDASPARPADAGAPPDAARPVDPRGDAGPTPVDPTPGNGQLATNSFFSFERAGDWTSTEATVTQETAAVTDGRAALAFTANGRTYIRSRVFDTSELPKPITKKLSLDVFLSEMQAGQHNIQLWFECKAANVYNGYVAIRGLMGVPPGAYATLVFDVPDQIFAALKGSHSGCQLWMEHIGVGATKYDRLGFVP